MKRYRQANEGVHAPEDLKEKAARPAQKRPRSRWMGAVAAVLAVAIIGGAAMQSGLFSGPNAPDPTASTITGPVGRSIGGPHALALAAYPEMPPWPAYDDYLSGTEDSEEAEQAYNEAYSAWWKAREALRSELGYDYGFLNEFLSRSTAQFLTDAGSENKIYSPLNVYMALSMLAETTGDNTRRQILDLLGADSIESVREHAATLWKDHYRDDGKVTSVLANSMWLRDDFAYTQETLDTLAEHYYASAFSGRMGSEEYTQALRDWLNEQTHGLLEEQAGGLELDADTVMALASTIYFKAAWSDQFPVENTRRDLFHAPDGDMEVDFMRRTVNDTFYWGDHFTAVQLLFQEGGSMWLILPDEGYSVDELVKSGEAMDFLLAKKSGDYDEETNELVGGWPGQERVQINLSMPKFDVSSDLDLIEGLQALGVADVFDMDASDFTPLGFDADDPVYVSKAQHAARVKVDEEGCEAAAYTVMIMVSGAWLPTDEVDFVLDRPFLFAITGEWTGLPLFTGVVNQPNG